MIHTNRLPTEIVQLIEQRFKGDLNTIEIPPPVFIAMKGHFISVNIEQGSLRCRFPILAEQLNPYGHMQGGIISAAIDNTIGPLSMLVAPPNVTRRMELKYSRPVTSDLDYIYVTARYLEQKKKMLFFEADVKDQEGNEYASAKSTHWIIK